FNILLSAVLAQYRSGDGALMHLIWPIRQAQRSSTSIHPCQWKVVTDPSSAERLDGAVGHARQHGRRDHFDHRDLILRRFLPQGIYRPSRLERQQPRLLDLDRRLGDPFLDDSLLGKRLAERYAPQDSLAHELERALRRANAAHAVMYAPRPQ